MRIVDCDTFLTMPVGTLYAKAATPPEYGFGPLEIKGETLIDLDFYSQRLVGDFVGNRGSSDRMTTIDALHVGETCAVDFDMEERDSLCEVGQRYAVFEVSDVEALIVRLQRALTDSQAGMG
ncbi:MAG: hypothetical protein EON93_18955 [Burkholderiales bacterium]|nr:MAG: hypothetical protein EON93_18955 [Burkholderiales bacterium]